jgi:DMSO/TMAO reductase YedYZ molybdopterin-dependent catalytic subunit
MLTMDSNQTKLVSILVIAVIVAGGAMVALQFFQVPEDTSSDYFIEVVGVGGNSQNVTLSEMMLMESVSGNSSYQNTYGNVRGVGEYTGVKVSDLLDLVGGVDEGFVVRVVAADGYSQTFERSKVYPNTTIWNIQGDMILAYEYNGTVVPDYEEGIRLAFIPDDGYYSNADANATTDPNPAAAGPQWVSNVVRIEILENLYNSTFSVSESLLRTFVSVTGEGGYKKKSGDIIGPFNFTGVPLTTLLQEFVTLPGNYILIAHSSDGYTSEYTKSVVEGIVNGYTPTGAPLEEINSTMVLAYEQDGVPITDGGPLKIVFLNADGNLTDGNRWAKDVVSITILELSSTTAILSNYILSQTDCYPVNDAYILDEKGLDENVRSEQGFYS